jgi:branched-chain amino acid transport system permease protein
VGDINFFVGSALAAFAGVMVSVLNNMLEPTMGSVPSYKALAIIVLGGLGSVRGTLAAALVLGVVESFGTIYLGHFLDRNAIAFLDRWNTKSPLRRPWPSACCSRCRST